jgi:hypothetical protein
MRASIELQTRIAQFLCLPPPRRVGLTTARRSRFSRNR